MLTIHDEQLKVFERVALEQFENHLLDRLREFWPDECCDLGEEGTRNAIQQAIRRARGHGIFSQRQLFRYVNLVFYLGPSFDDAPAFPWARAILSNDRLNEVEKLDKLVDTARAGDTPRGG